MARRTRTPKIKWLTYTVQAYKYAEKLLAGVWFDNHSSVFITFIMICVNQVQVPGYSGLPFTRASQSHAKFLLYM